MFENNLIKICLLIFVLMNFTSCNSDKKTTTSLTPIFTTPINEGGKYMSKSEFNLEEIKKYIYEADALKFKINIKLSNFIIGKYGNTDVYGTDGVYSSYDKVVDLMKDYYSEELIGLELYDVFLINISGKVGRIAATGIRPRISEKSEFRLIKNDTDLKQVEVQTFIPDGEGKRVYTLKRTENTKWLITERSCNTIKVTAQELKNATPR